MFGEIKVRTGQLECERISNEFGFSKLTNSVRFERLLCEVPGCNLRGSNGSLENYIGNIILFLTVNGKHLVARAAAKAAKAQGAKSGKLMLREVHQEQQAACQ